MILTLVPTVSPHPSPHPAPSPARAGRGEVAAISPCISLYLSISPAVQDEERSRLQREHDEATQRDRARKTQMQVQDAGPAAPTPSDPAPTAPDPARRNPYTPPTS